MTTIVGLARDGAVYMAADSQTNVYDRPVSARKIARLSMHGRPALLGVAGDGALFHLASGPLEIPPLNDFEQGSLDRYAHAYATVLTDIASARGLLQEGRMSGNLLFGYCGRLWTLVHHQAIAHPDGLASVGTGEGPAIGALWALTVAVGSVGLADAVEAACDAGIRFDRYSGGPVQVETLEVAAE